jgi:hypothetical protein
MTKREKGEYDISNSTHHWKGLEEAGKLAGLDANCGCREPSRLQGSQLCQCTQRCEGFSSESDIILAYDYVSVHCTHPPYHGFFDLALTILLILTETMNALALCSAHVCGFKRKAHHLLNKYTSLECNREGVIVHPFIDIVVRPGVEGLCVVVPPWNPVFALCTMYWQQVRCSNDAVQVDQLQEWRSADSSELWCCNPHSGVLVWFVANNLPPVYKYTREALIVWCVQMQEVKSTGQEETLHARQIRVAIHKYSVMSWLSSP